MHRYPLLAWLVAAGLLTGCGAPSAAPVAPPPAPTVASRPLSTATAVPPTLPPTATPLPLPRVGDTLQVAGWTFSLAKLEARPQLRLAGKTLPGPFYLVWVDARNGSATSAALDDRFTFTLDGSPTANTAPTLSADQIRQLLTQEHRDSSKTPVKPKALIHPLFVYQRSEFHAQQFRIAAKSDATQQAPFDLSSWAAALPTAVPTATVRVADAYRTLPAYSAGGNNWRNFLVAPGWSPDQMVALGKTLHMQYPTSPLAFFDDDSRFPEYVAYQQHYGQVRDTDGKVKDITDCLDITYCAKLVKEGKDAYPDPSDWEAAHAIGIVQKMATRPGGQWQFTFFIGPVAGSSVDLEP